MLRISLVDRLSLRDSHEGIGLKNGNFSLLVSSFWIIALRYVSHLMSMAFVFVGSFGSNILVRSSRGEIRSVERTKLQSSAAASRCRSNQFEILRGGSGCMEIDPALGINRFDHDHGV